MLFTQPQAPWLQSKVPSWQSREQKVSVQFGAWSFGTHEEAWQQEEGTQSEAVVHSAVVCVLFELEAHAVINNKNKIKIVFIKIKKNKEYLKIYKKRD